MPVHPLEQADNVLVLTIYRSFIGTIVLMTVENKNNATRIGLLISYYITLSFWSAQTLALSMISRNVAGQTKKAAVVTCNFISWATAAAVGTLPAYLVGSLHSRAEICFIAMVFI